METLKCCTVQPILFVCFCLEFFVPLENLSLIWRRHHCRWRLQILTCAWHLWPLSSEGSLAFHTYDDTGHPFIMVISEDPWHSHLLPNVWQWNCHYLFSRLRSVAAGIRTPNLPLAGRTLKPTAPPPRPACNRILQYKNYTCINNLKQRRLNSIG